MATAATSGTVKRLFDTGAHFAQVKARRHPSMKRFLVGTKGRQEIFDLAETEAQLAAAQSVMTTLAREGKTVLFVGGKVEIAPLVKAAASEIGAPYVATRWLGGTISNWTEIKRRVDRLAELESGSLTSKQHTKLELLKIDREKKRLQERLDGITTMTKRPDALLVVDTKHEKYAVKEAREAGIPIIALMSSDCDATEATYPIVGNDSSRETVQYVLSELVKAFTHGQTA